MWKRLVLLSLVMGLSSSVGAQVYFGQNKIQYTSFDWQVLTTEHFQIYFYPEETWLAEVAARAAEDAYRDLRIKFRHHIFSKIPIVVYSAPNLFSQTNITPSLLPEAVGGFTEFFKGRVVMPFTGSYADFVRILRHELVHVFTYSKLDFAMRTHHRIDGVPPPLWFVEGLAEHWSRSWGSEADLVLRQMVLEDRLVGIRQMNRIHGSFYMYKVGESILEYWAERFGDDAIARLFDNWPRAKSFNGIVELTLGESVETLDREWSYQLKKRYYPEFEQLDLPGAVADAVSPPGFFTSPATTCVPDGDSCRSHVVYLGNRLGYSALYNQRLPHGKPEAVVRGGRSGRFESLHLFRAGIDAAPDGRVAFSSKSNERDVLYVYDLSEEKIVDERKFDHLVSIVTPAFSPDGSRVVFAAAGIDGIMDLYLLDLRSQDPPARLTQDVYRDSEPIFSPAGDAVVFASDRGREGKTGAVNLYYLDLGSGALAPLTDTTGINGSPTYLGPDTLLFVSDRGGSYDVYGLVGRRELYRITALSSGAFTPRADPRSGALYFSAHTQFGYRIYRLDARAADWDSVAYVAPAMDVADWQVDRDSGLTTASADVVKQYRHDFSMDIAQSAISYDAVFGTIGGFQMAFSDMLGDEYYYVLVSNPANTTGEFLSSFNLAVTYLNRKHRVNYGWGVFHLFNDYLDDVEGVIAERQAGGVFFASYPLSRFRRIELTNFLRYGKRDWLTPPRTREGLLSTPTLSLVYDNSLWEPTGPIEGWRANISGGLTYDVTKTRVLNRIFWTDLRHYYRLGARSAWATRLYAFLSGGEEPVRRYFGGSWDFRGFSRQEFYVRKILFASNELRFPLINQLAIDFPVGRLNFSRIMGALFFDAGSAWDRGNPEWRGAYGFGWRVALARFVVLRFDFAQTTDFRTVDPGLEFDFFFGWNF